MNEGKNTGCGCLLLLLVIGLVCMEIKWENRDMGDCLVREHVATYVLHHVKTSDEVVPAHDVCDKWQFEHGERGWFGPLSEKR